MLHGVHGNFQTVHTSFTGIVFACQVPVSHKYLYLCDIGCASFLFVQKCNLYEKPLPAVLLQNLIYHFKGWSSPSCEMRRLPKRKQLVVSSKSLQQLSNFNNSSYVLYCQPMLWCYLGLAVLCCEPELWCLSILWYQPQI